MIDSEQLWKRLKVSRSTFYRKVLPVLKKKKLAAKIGAQYRFDEKKVEKYFFEEQTPMVFEQEESLKKTVK